MTDRIARLIPSLMLAGVLLGGLCGYYLPGASLALDFLGRLFLGALTLLVIPLIVTGTITGLNAFGEARKAGRTGLRVLFYFAATTVVAVVIGIVVGLTLVPARGLLPVTGGAAELDWLSVSDALAGLIPGNLVQAVAEGRYLGVVLLALLLGGVLTAMGTKARSVVTLCQSLQEGFLKIVVLLLYAAPVGLFALVGSAVARQSSDLGHWASAGGTYALMAIVALAIHGGVVIPLALWSLSRRSPVGYYRDLGPAFLAAFGTSTSIAAFPVTYSCLSERCKVDNRAISLMLPLGSVINLDGTAICMVVASLFAAALFGIEIGLSQVLLVGVLGVVLSIGAAGIPSATLITAPILFGAVGLSVEQAAAAWAMVLGFDWLVDRFRAVVNLAGDGVGAAVVAESFELKTARRAPRERKPSRVGGERRTPARDRRPARSDSRSSSRRPDRPVPAARGRKSTTTDDAPPVKPRTPRTRSARQDKSPLEMKPPSTPSLELLPGTTEKDRNSQSGSGERRTSRTSRGPAASTRSDRQRTASSSERKPQTRPRSASTARKPAAETKKPAAPQPPAAEAKKVPASQPPATEETAKLEEGVSEYGRLNPSIVARELARVSAQLQSDQSESAETERTDRDAADRGAGGDLESRGATSPDPTGAAEADETDDDETPDRTELTVTSPEEHPADDEQPAPHLAEADTEPDSAPPATEDVGEQYGRTHRQRGAAFKKSREAQSPAPEPSESEESETPTGFSTDDASFGRVKRKRTR